MAGAVTTESLSDLIGRVYDCALDPGRWEETLTQLRLVLDFGQVIMGVLALPSGQQLLTIASGVEPYWLERLPNYSSDIVEQWGGAEFFNSYPLDEPAVLSRDVPRERWEHGRYAVEWCYPQGLTDGLAFTLARDRTTHGSVGMSRHQSAGEIGEREVEAIRLLIPHFQRAVAISKVLDLRAVTSASFESALDVLGSGVVLVDTDLRIIHANRAAEALLRSGDPILNDHGSLALRSTTRNAALSAAVRQAANAEDGMGRRGFGIPAPRAAGDPAVLHVLPLRSGRLRAGLKPKAAAAIFVAPALAAELVSNEALSALFDLTSAEARLFAQIAAGHTLAQAARQLGVSASTAKTHLLRVFNKTGLHRQADLVRLAAALGAPA